MSYTSSRARESVRGDLEIASVVHFVPSSHNNERRVGMLAFQTEVRQLWKAAKPPNNDGGGAK